MKYRYPDAFALARAQELGRLVQSAYDQLDKGAAWTPPAGYAVLARLSVREIWKLKPFSEVLEHLLQPVPFGFVAIKGNDVYVVLRGTRTPLEWFDDFTAQPVDFQPGGQPWGHTTLGFKLLYDELGPPIQQAIAAHGGGAAQSIFVTGHSLGAAVAHMAAAGIAAQFGARPISYTFCGPRTGDAPFAAKFDATPLTTWRIFNTEDLVPTVPPAAVKLLEPNVNLQGLAVLTQSLSKSLSTFVHLSPVGYQHIGYPIAVTFHRDTIAGNHDLGSLCTEIAQP
ncbi:MAG TPA: lipase family protein [Thermoanaerobaculia bacterium]|nr:lipase family protein [Thermoanaerobaculia bacterium]